MTKASMAPPKAGLFNTIARAARDFLRPRYRTHLGQQSKLVPIDDIVANAGREQPLAD
jgi:hypothetical protein